MDTGNRINLDPDSGMVSLRRWYEWDQRGPINERTYAFRKDQPTVVEIFLDRRCCLVGRLPENATGSLALLAQDGPVAFERIQIRRPSLLGP